MPPAAESLKGDPCLFRDPGKGGLPEVGLHQGGTILTGSHGDDPASELRWARSMDILVKLLPEPFLIEKEPLHDHNRKIKPEGMRVSTRAAIPWWRVLMHPSQPGAARQEKGGRRWSRNYSFST